VKVFIIGRHKGQVFGDSTEEQPTSGTVKAVSHLVEILLEEGHTVYYWGNCDGHRPHALKILAVDTSVSMIEETINCSREPTVVVGVSYAAEVFRELSIPSARKIWWWHNTYTSNALEMLQCVGKGQIDFVIPVAHNIVAINLGMILRVLGIRGAVTFVRSKYFVVNNAKRIITQHSRKDPKTNALKLVFIGNFGPDSGFHKFLEVATKLRKSASIDLEIALIGGNLHSLPNQSIALPEGVQNLGLKTPNWITEFLLEHNTIVINGLSGLESASYAFQESLLAASGVLTRIRGGQFELALKAKHSSVICLPLNIISSKIGQKYLVWRFQRLLINKDSPNILRFFDNQRMRHREIWLSMINDLEIAQSPWINIKWLIIHRCTMLIDSNR